MILPLNSLNSLQEPKRTDSADVDVLRETLLAIGRIPMLTGAEEERLAPQRAENCRRARSHLSAMESGQRIARVNDKGEREVLDDRGRAEEMRQAREVIASDCR